MTSRRDRQRPEGKRDGPVKGESQGFSDKSEHPVEAMTRVDLCQQTIATYVFEGCRGRAAHQCIGITKESSFCSFRTSLLPEVY